MHPHVATAGWAAHWHHSGTFLQGHNKGRTGQPSAMLSITAAWMRAKALLWQADMSASVTAGGTAPDTSNRVCDSTCTPCMQVLQGCPSSPWQTWISTVERGPGTWEPLGCQHYCSVLNRQCRQLSTLHMSRMHQPACWVTRTFLYPYPRKREVFSRQSSTCQALVRHAPYSASCVLHAAGFWHAEKTGAQQGLAFKRTALCRVVMAFRRSPLDTLPRVSAAPGMSSTPSSALEP